MSKLPAVIAKNAWRRLWHPLIRQPAQASLRVTVSIRVYERVSLTTSNRLHE
jgi:hypothetical protein